MDIKTTNGCRADVTQEGFRLGKTKAEHMWDKGEAQSSVEKTGNIVVKNK